MAKSMVPPEVAENMKDVKHKIVVLSGKGGVGKTTVATNLAMSFAMQGFKSGILDVDIYGPNVPKLLGLEGQHPMAGDNFIEPLTGPLEVSVMSMGFLLRESDDAVAWRGPLVARAITQFLSDVRWGELDVMVVDLPPGTGDEILSILQSIPDIDGVVIISTPQEVAVQDARRAIRLVEKMNVPVLGIVENMSEFVCPECGKSYKLFGEGAAKKASEDFKIDHLGTLPLDPKVIAMSDEGTPFVVKEPDSPTTKAFDAVVKKLSKKIKLKKE
ncbi:ATP-binding protein [Candidatus Thorarchaeota archaeon]|jgi:ATP-binding protein involved in chromosome partitioning|nr:MAG: ATP-binding protein [Candidatus Thorarchaeota archaeon]